MEAGFSLKLYKNHGRMKHFLTFPGHCSKASYNRLLIYRPGHLVSTNLSSETKYEFTHMCILFKHLLLRKYA